jgi:hypothetical protein
MKGPEKMECTSMYIVLMVDTAFLQSASSTESEALGKGPYSMRQ